MPLVSLLGALLTSAVVQDPGDAQTLRSELSELRTRLEALEQDDPPLSGGVDLSDEELPSLYGLFSDDPLSAPWYENFQLSAFIAGGYIDSGHNVGVQADGAFLLDAATLFVDARAWEDVTFFAEVRLSNFYIDYDSSVSVGELYARFHDLLPTDGGTGLGIKVGRIDIPFGEEYLAWDAPDNALILNSAVQPYGLDEGILLHGDLHGVGWAVALMDGLEANSFEDDASKMVAAKVYGDPTDHLHLSASALTTGETSESAFHIAGKPLTPVGSAMEPSTLGVSPSTKVETEAWQVNASLQALGRGSVSLAYGGASIDDDVSAFDRDLMWFVAEPSWRLTDELRLTARWSQVGTFDGDEGYKLDGKITAFGRAFGFDTQSLRRVAVGITWTPSPHVLLKAEVGKDRFELIDLSPFNPMNDDRLYFGMEAILVL